MSDNFQTIVDYLIKKQHFNSIETANDLKIKHDRVIEVIKLIHSSGDYFILNDKCYENWKLSNLGKKLVENREIRIKLSLSKEELDPDDVAQRPTELDQETFFNLNIIKNGGCLNDEEKINIYMFKKYIEKYKINCLEGELINQELFKSIDIATTVTSDMLVDDKWKTVSLVSYNFDQMGMEIQIGNLHWMTLQMNNVRQILFELGFVERRSNHFVDHPFWINEALLVSRPFDGDEYFKTETITNSVPIDYFNKLKTVNNDMNNHIEISDYDKNVNTILRTNLHNECARLLYSCPRNDRLSAHEFFIGKVLSKKPVDKLHLPEYHMIQIVLIETQLRFNYLIALLSLIFEKLRIEHVDYKPAYQSFTEPTLESMCYHYGHDQWLNIGKSGMVRPEILKAMNFPQNINALVLSINLERIAMIKKDVLDINNPEN